MSALSKAEQYLEFLGREGYRPEIDEEGDVQFKMEGFFCFLHPDEDDPTYFQAFLPNVWEIESGEERLRALEASVHANTEIKAAKVIIVQEKWVTVVVEMFTAEPNGYQAVFDRCMAALKAAGQAFADKMQESE